MTAAGQHQFAKWLAISTFVVVLVLAVVAAIQLPQVVSVKDSTDISACRAEFSADLNDARWNAVFDLIRQGRQNAEVEVLLAPIDDAAEAYRKAIDDSRENPDEFLRLCRK